MLENLSNSVEGNTFGEAAINALRKTRGHVTNASLILDLPYVKFVKIFKEYFGITPRKYYETKMKNKK